MQYLEPGPRMIVLDHVACMCEAVLSQSVTRLEYHGCCS